jgi:hypothetical protein
MWKKECHKTHYWILDCLNQRKPQSVQIIVESRYYYATNVKFTERGRVYVITQVR